MTAPAPTTRQTPGGIKMRKGASTLITLAIDPDISLWEVEVTPAGFDVGDSINTTTMHNVTYETKEPPAYIEGTDGSMVCGYDSKVISQIKAAMGQRTTITETYPNGDTIAYFGYLKSFTPQNITKDNMPLANVVWVQTNADTDGNEAGPVHTPASGT